MRQQGPLLAPATRYEIRALSFLRHSYDVSVGPPNPRRALGDAISLVVVPEDSRCDTSPGKLQAHFTARGHLLCQRTDPESHCVTANVVAPNVNFKVPLAWLGYCQENHSTLCLPKKKSGPIAGFRLIDCESRRVVETPDSVPYVTLSYVWGDVTPRRPEFGPDQMPESFALPEDIPPVILDAMIATEQLGFRYLWVDRYCIDEKEKHIQIRQMDLIYERSELTIVAAAGEDASKGLPGINEPRQQRSGINTGKHMIRQTLTHPHRSIKLSKWIARGWPFQEAAISRRLLVFMNEQLYFECRSMNCSETLKYPLDTAHTRNKKRFRDIMRTGLFAGRDECIQREAIFGVPFGSFDDSRRPWSYHFKKYLIYATNYTSRDLKFDSDSLNAFAGVMRRMESGRHIFPQLMGIPYFVMTTSEQDRDLALHCLVAGLCWRHLDACWANGGGGKRRREGFPSWTWAGWAGTVSWMDLFSFNKMDIRSLIENFRCELDTGILLDLSQHTSSRLANPEIPLTVAALCFDAWVCPPGMIELGGTPANPEWKMAGFDWDLHISAFNGSPDDLLRAVHLSEVQCVLIGKGLYNSYFLVLEKQGRSRRRIGTGEVIWNQYWTENSNRVDERFAELVDISTQKASFHVV